MSPDPTPWDTADLSVLPVAFSPADDATPGGPAVPFDPAELTTTQVTFDTGGVG